MIYVYELMVHGWKSASFNRWNIKIKSNFYAKSPNWLWETISFV